MSKIASYLGNHLRGEVVTDTSVRHLLSQDGSILKILPLLAVYPFNTSDVRKIAHFAWQLAEKGHTLPLTVRGGGNSRVGAAIGNGAIISLSEHLSTILEVDTKQKLVRIQPGVSLLALNEAMKTHGLLWPVSSSAGKTTTVGGALGNNSYSATGAKFGDAAEWVDQLEVVLSNGDIIQTGRLSKRELSKKKGLAGLEGEIYRQLDGLIADNTEIIADLSRKLGNAGYGIDRVKDKKGNFNLTPLIAGSQGSLGIVTEAILRLDHYHPRREVVIASLSSLDGFEQLVESLQKFEPTRFEFIDKQSLEVASSQGIKISDLLPEDKTIEDIAGIVALELTDAGRGKSKAKKAVKQLDRAGHFVVRSDGDFEAAHELWQFFDRIKASLSSVEVDHKMTIPVIEDALLPREEILDFFTKTRALAKKHRVSLVGWSNLGTGTVHVRPLLNLRNLSDKQKATKLVSDYYSLVVQNSGSVAGEYGEGRTRAQVAAQQFTVEEKELFVAVKKIFDAHNIFNPGVKVNGEKDILSKMNESYTNARGIQDTAFL